MLQKKQRVDRKLFSIVLRDGKRVFSQHLTLITALSFDHQNHVSFVASKKAVGNAVARHKIVRRGYNAVRNFIPSFKKFSICIFYFKAGATGRSFKELQDEIKQILIQSGLLVR